MKDLEKANELLKEFIEKIIAEAEQLNESLDKRKQELEKKEEEISDVETQLEYVHLLERQLINRLDVLLEERNMLLELLDEKESEIKKHLCEDSPEK